MGFMKSRKRKALQLITLTCLSFLLVKTATHAQQASLDTVKARQFDMGKMWTFENPPIDYFKTTYDLTTDAEWFEKAQLASLRFSTYCSASFVSAEGLVMTNHHCSRESGVAVQRANEDFNANGFYATKPGDERKVPELFVDQLVKLEDITERVQEIEKQGEDDYEKLTLRDQGLENIVKEYSEKPEWKDLEIQAVTLYSGGKFSLYGFKRYNDVRLVFMPELDLGFFGGDPDNFTYPRYNLDVTFFRVYDESGKPLKSPHFFKFNPDGVKENEPVFVIGNPGTTGRLQTVDELEMERDYKLPYLIEVLKNRKAVLESFNVTAKNDSITNEIFSFENGVKSFSGQLKGMRDPYLMARKKAFENKFKKDVRENPKLADEYSVWDQIAEQVQVLSGTQHDLMLFQANPLFRGEMLTFGQQLVDYAALAKSNPQRAETLREMLSAFTPKNEEVEIGYLAAHIEEAQSLLGDSDTYVRTILNDRSPREAAEWIYEHTKLKDKAYVESLIEKGEEALEASTDPIIQLSLITQPRYMKSIFAARDAYMKLELLQGRLGRLLFDTYGTSIPPDATMSLRISDGVVKSVDYNGTQAPIHTTYYGLYDRHLSHKGTYPWSLPDRWKNPSTELLKAPVNFISTNDIVGGNSGSPLVNSKLEAVGLAFDGNMESLTGYFIFAPDTGNRTVSVHVGGIMAALKHVYKTKRLTEELEGK
jgi:hypothetical protein